MNKPLNDLLITEPNKVNSVVMRKLDAAAAYSFSFIAKDRPLTSLDMVKKALQDEAKDIGSGISK